MRLRRERRSWGKGCREEWRNEGRHDISLACADSSSFVTVAAINNSTVLSLWIIRVGLGRAVAVALVGVGSVQFSSVQGVPTRDWKGTSLRGCHSCHSDMASILNVHLVRSSLSRLNLHLVKSQYHDTLNLNLILNGHHQLILHKHPTHSSKHST